jgi:hypothetical protein
LLNKLKKWEVDDSVPPVVAQGGDPVPARKQAAYGFPLAPAVGGRQIEGSVVAREEHVRGLTREDVVVEHRRWPRPASR